ncbi:MAG: GTP 3',8-cyclase MoaA [Gemmatimonadota bacterium]|nr:GTP 3',8-cyclase MoaA [Gemmatimonadota bacterium]
MTSGPAPRDRFGRPLGSLRISVTDRCNLRCSYCMPEDSYVWLPRASILTFEEIERLAGVFVGLGAFKLRLTGGEPLLRQDLPDLVARLGAIPGLSDLAMTTNALLLTRFAAALREAGLRRITVSLDTLRPDRYRDMSRADRLAEALAGIEAAKTAGFAGLKLNAVVVRGVNDDELFDLVDFGRARDMEVRFIEYMDVGGATRWTDQLVVSRREILERFAGRYGSVLPMVDPDSRAPAERFQLPDGTTFGIIASTTEPFCRTCDRSRLTADGMWLRCLYAAEGVSFRDLMRGGASDEELAEVIRRGWADRTDRGAEERASATNRGALYQIDGLRRDPHKEMHTRGG